MWQQMCRFGTAVRMCSAGHEYAAEERSKKEIQLEANLKWVMSEFAETIAPKLVLQPCQADGNPAKIRTFNILSVLDLLY
jgi:hypothetical protein